MKRETGGQRRVRSQEGTKEKIPLVIKSSIDRSEGSSVRGNNERRGQVTQIVIKWKKLLWRGLKIVMGNPRKKPWTLTRFKKKQQWIIRSGKRRREGTDPKKGLYLKSKKTLNVVTGAIKKPAIRVLKNIKQPQTYRWKGATFNIADKMKNRGAKTEFIMKQEKKKKQGHRTKRDSRRPPRLSLGRIVQKYCRHHIESAFFYSKKRGMRFGFFRAERSKSTNEKKHTKNAQGDLLVNKVINRQRRNQAIFK